MDARKKELVSLKRMHVVRSLMIYSLILVPTIGIGEYIAVVSRSL